MANEPSEGQGPIDDEEAEREQQSGTQEQGEQQTRQDEQAEGEEREMPNED